MPKNPFDVLRAQETEQMSTTYIDGIGFLPVNKKYATTLGIRRMANMVCILVLFYFLLQNFLRLPFTFISQIVGADVQINHYTGLIVASKSAKAAILLLSNIASLFIISSVCGFVYLKSYRVAGLFKKPYRGVTSIAVPIVMSLYLFGIFLGTFQGAIGKAVGLVFPFSLKPISLTTFSIFEIAGTLFFVLLQEIFFRGLVLTPLRRYGDGFAIIAASLVASLWAGGFLELLPTFLLSLPLCYFAIRSGSVITAIICRICCEGLTLLFRISNSVLEHSLSQVVILLLTVLVVFFAAFTFVSFIKMDSAAFHIKKCGDGITSRYKLFIFVSSVSFLALIAFLLIRVVNVVQIIG